jgi:hypothetical protein
VPGELKVCGYDWPGIMQLIPATQPGLESNSPSSAVAECEPLSLLIQVTLSPTVIVRSMGE